MKEKISALICLQKDSLNLEEIKSTVTILMTIAMPRSMPKWEKEDYGPWKINLKEKIDTLNSTGLIKILANLSKERRLELLLSKSILLKWFYTVKK